MYRNQLAIVAATVVEQDFPGGDQSPGHALARRERDDGVVTNVRRQRVIDKKGFALFGPQAMHNVAIALLTMTRWQMRKQHFVNAVETIREPRTTDRTGNTDDRANVGGDLRIVDEKLQNVVYALRVAEQHEGFVGITLPGLHEIGNLYGIVIRTRSTADHDRPEFVTRCGEILNGRCERPGGLAKTLTECTRDKQRLHMRPRWHVRWNVLALVRQVMEPVCAARGFIECICRQFPAEIIAKTGAFIGNVFRRLRQHVWGR